MIFLWTLSGNITRGKSKSWQINFLLFQIIKGWPSVLPLVFLFFHFCCRLQCASRLARKDGCYHEEVLSKENENKNWKIENTGNFGLWNLLSRKRHNNKLTMGWREGDLTDRTSTVLNMFHDLNVFFPFPSYIPVPIKRNQCQNHTLKLIWNAKLLQGKKS